ncbi:MAG: four helix bundle protein [Candidatus Hydrogenedentes bacterium]|nr:four helix bundle protein [Candidatus Hydrogenedentota bacterium]
MPEDFVPPHGGYKDLISYQKAKIIYDATVYFCDRFLNRKDRTRDQMIQAARSGKQNIVEGSLASVTSKQTELFLTSVAWSSLGELLEDYEDYCRINDIAEWSEEDPGRKRMRELNRIPQADYETFRKGIEHEDPAVCVNVIMGLVRVTRYLLAQQMKRLRKDFVEVGGLRERMTRARLEERERQRREGKREKDGKDIKDRKDPRDRNWP